MKKILKAKFHFCLHSLLFADDFVELSDSKQGLQDMINVVHAYSKKWHFEANVTKCAVVVFRNERSFNGEWFWENSALPHFEYYNYLGVKFTYNYGHWDGHIKDLVTAGKCKVNSLLRTLHNPCLSLYVKRQVILQMSILHLSLLLELQ